jgi:hypothetical protein
MGNAAKFVVVNVSEHKCSLAQQERWEQAQSACAVRCIQQDRIEVEATPQNAQGVGDFFQRH